MLAKGWCNLKKSHGKGWNWSIGTDGSVFWEKAYAAHFGGVPNTSKVKCATSFVVFLQIS